MKNKWPFSCALLLFSLAGCHPKNASHPEMLSIQIIDRNGFNETITSQDKLKFWTSNDFNTPQPFQKVLRVFKRSEKDPQLSILTTYHVNGMPSQLLEIRNGRAHGKYQEWYPTGSLHFEMHIIEGIPEVEDAAKASWVFDGVNRIFYENGQLQAEIRYDKGQLQGDSLYYYPHGQLHKKLLYSRHQLDGEFLVFHEKGTLLEKCYYVLGAKDGLCQGFHPEGELAYEEHYRDQRLSQGHYWDLKGEEVSEVKEGEGTRQLFDEGELILSQTIQQGKVEGEVKHFEKGLLSQKYFLFDGKKRGEEYFYNLDTQKPQLLLDWENGILQGIVKTWYPSGALESQKEFRDNVKEGICTAYFLDGSLMLVEEYHQDQLVKGSYFARGQASPVSKVENGKGIATLFDAQGKLLHKIPYEKGIPLASPVSESE